MPLIVVEITTPHSTDWYLTNAPVGVHAHHPDWHGQGITLHDPKEVIARQFKCWALLSSA